MVSDVINSIVTFIFLVAYQSVCYVLKSRICRRSSFICSIHFSFIAPVEGLCYHFIFVLLLYFFYHSSRRKDQMTVLNLKFGTQDFTDPGLLKIRWTHRFNFCRCGLPSQVPSPDRYSGYPCITRCGKVGGPKMK